MSVVIIIGGSGGLKNAVDQANQAASQNNWTQAQIDWMASQFAAWNKTIDTKIASFNAGNPP
jgi:hypothetical protein